MTITLLSQMACSFGIRMATSNALALALVHYNTHYWRCFEFI